MASFITAADIISVAVEIERKGQEFYRNLVGKTTNAEDKRFFTMMADEEANHERIFAAMLQRVGGTAIPPGASDEEYQHYMRALIDSHCLLLPEHAVLAEQSPFGQAIQLEKDTLVFFLAMEDMVPESEKVHVRGCADEERRHLRKLSVQLAQNK